MQCFLTKAGERNVCAFPGVQLWPIHAYCPTSPGTEAVHRAVAGRKLRGKTQAPGEPDSLPFLLGVFFFVSGDRVSDYNQPLLITWLDYPE